MNRGPRINHVTSAVSSFYSVSRAIGLAPFTFPDVCSSKRAKLYTLMVFCLVWIGLGSVILDIWQDYLDVSNARTHLLSRLLMFLTCGLAGLSPLLTAMAFSTRNMQVIMKQIEIVDGYLFQKQVNYKRIHKFIRIELFFIFSQFLYFFIYDLYVLITAVHEGHKIAFFERHALLILSDMTLVEFVNFVLYIKTRAAEVNRKLNFVCNKKLNLFQLNSDHLQRTPCGVSVRRGEARKRAETAERIRTLRKTHVELHRLSEAVNSSYGFRILLKLLFMLMSIVSFTHATLASLAVPRDKEDPNLLYFFFLPLCWVLSTVLELVTVSLCCHAASREARQTSSLVHGCRLRDIADEDVLAELDGFARQLASYQLAFTACGIVDLDLTLLLSVASTTTSYIVIMLQH